jgi:WD40 repeat protein
MVATGRQVCEIPGTQPTLGEVDYDIAFDPRGSVIATGGSGGAVSMWSTSTCQRVDQWQTRSTNVLAVAYSPDGTTLATTGTDRAITLWDAATGEESSSIRTSHSTNVNALAYSAEGSILASRDVDGVAQLWDANSRRQIGQTLSNVSDFALSPDGSTIATSAFRGNGVKLWNVHTGQQVGEPFGPDCRCGGSVAYGPDGVTLAVSLTIDMETLQGGNGTLLAHTSERR